MFQFIHKNGHWHQSCFMKIFFASYLLTQEKYDVGQRLGLIQGQCQSVHFVVLRPQLLLLVHSAQNPGNKEKTFLKFNVAFFFFLLKSNMTQMITCCKKMASSKVLLFTCQHVEQKPLYAISSICLFLLSPDTFFYK